MSAFDTGLIAGMSGLGRTLLGGQISESSTSGGSQNMSSSRSEGYGYTTWDRAAAYNMAMQEIRNSFNAAEAEKNRNWQEKMSNTAYQRMIYDLKAAGLNPILRVSNGPASTPGGRTASANMRQIGRESYSNSRSHAESYGTSGYSGYSTSVPAIAEYAGNLSHAVGTFISEVGPAMRKSAELRQNAVSGILGMGGKLANFGINLAKKLAG